MQSRRPLRQRGVAIVEFALVLPLLLLLVVITTEFGRAVYEYNAVVKSVRNGARYLSAQQPNTHQTEAANLVKYGSLSNTGQPLVRGLTAATVNADWTTFGANPTIRVVTVRVTGYQFASMFASVFGISFGNLTYPEINATMRSYQ